MSLELLGKTETDAQISFWLLAQKEAGSAHKRTFVILHGFVRPAFSVSWEQMTSDVLGIHVCKQPDAQPPPSRILTAQRTLKQSHHEGRDAMNFPVPWRCLLPQEAHGSTRLPGRTCC